jgi:hypothetical protein
VTASFGILDGMRRRLPAVLVAVMAAPPQNSGVREISRWIVPLRHGTQDVKVLGQISYVSLQGSRAGPASFP